MKNITLSIDDELFQAGREYARAHDISFNVLVRKLVEQTVISKQREWLEDSFALMDRAAVNSQGKIWTRDELYRV